MHYVSVVLIGGFANRIFVIHAALEYAKQTHKQFVLIKKHMINDAHEGPDLTLKSLESLLGPFEYISDNTNTTNWIRVNDPDNNAFSYKKIPTYVNQSVLFHGYFQSPKYFISNYPTTQIKQKEKKPNTYFLHIRLGDYCNHKDYKIPLKKYYSEAIMQIMESDIQAKFLVFSNENHKVEKFIKDNIHVPFDYTLAETQTAYDTLLEMASCSGAICANSSLSWMGAYYQQEPRKNIYMPYPWMNPSKKKTHFDLYPDWAIMIDLTK